MEILNIQNDSLLIKYRIAIFEFENYLNDNYSIVNIFSAHRGYLINLKDYEKIKEVINYKKYIEYIDYYKKNFKSIYNPTRIFKINQIEFKKPNYLINMILNKNKYIFINTNLWKLICDDNKKYEDYIIYKININDISFNLDNTELSFKKNNNIIDITTLNCKCNCNYHQIKKIKNDILNYYNFEKSISHNLKNKIFSIEPSYLVDIRWINMWKLFTNYENIKNSQQDIMNKLI